MTVKYGMQYAERVVEAFQPVVYAEHKTPLFTAKQRLCTCSR